MGAGFAFAFMAFMLLVFAAVAGIVFRAATRHWTQHAPPTEGRRIFLRRAGLLPAMLAFYALIFLAGYGVWNEIVRHRGLGFGDDMEASLPHDYQLTMIDVADRGWLRPRGRYVDQLDREAVTEVHQMQVSGDFLLGSAGDSTFFMLNSATRERWDFRSLTDLETAARAKGIATELEPLGEFYREHRYDRVDGAAFIVFWIFPIAAMVWFVRRLLDIRKSARAIAML